MPVGFVGLGNMGQGMADNLLTKGANLSVFTRTRSKVDAMVEKGATGPATLKELVASCDLILTCLPDVQTSRQLILGEDGIIANATAGQIVVDHGTVDMQTTKDCYNAAKEKGVYFLDAPISGGPLGASGGTLSIMVGGDDHAYQTALNEFERMGANIRHMGPSGAGTAMKLINQLLTGVNTAAAAEAFALANAASVDIMTAAELLKVSFGGSTMVARSAPITAERNFANSGAPARILDKDLNIILEFAKSEGLALELTRNAHGMFAEMMAQDHSEYDVAAVLEIIEQRSGK